MDIFQRYCLNNECEDYAKRAQGIIVCYDIYGKHKTKLLRSRTCKTRFPERCNTVFFGLHLEEDMIERVLRCLAKGNSIYATAGIMGIDKDTVCRIFERASNHSQTVLNELLVDLHLEE